MATACPWKCDSAVLPLSSPNICLYERKKKKKTRPKQLTFLKIWDKQSTVRNSSKPWKLEDFQSLEFWDWPFRTKDFFFSLKLIQIYPHGIIVDNIKIWAIITTFTPCASNQLFWKLDSPAHDFLLLQNCHAVLKSCQQFFL